jgi:protein-S-isoprenylcysteine O-methyltransferase Ste14
MGTLLIVLLILGTIGIIIFSWWFSIKDKRYHGIYRFFAFECLFILVLLNWHTWFKDAFSIHQIFSWIFLIASMIPAFYGFYLLKKMGKPEGKLENTSQLVVSGIYRYIRHPLYGSLVLLGIGIYLKGPLDIMNIVLCIVNTIALFATAKVEEKEMIQRFGSEYKEYMKITKMFIPFVL